MTIKKEVRLPLINRDQEASGKQQNLTIDLRLSENKKICSMKKFQSPV